VFDLAQNVANKDKYALLTQKKAPLFCNSSAHSAGVN